MNEKLELVQEIFRDLLDDEELVITEESSMETVEGWDSLLQINLIAAIEDECDIKFSVNDITKIHSVKDILSYM
ncbi:MAG: acyl carrier protein [Eubacterium sp.]|nr:acyl carrier protein [Eubacterium sp.]